MNRVLYALILLVVCICSLGCDRLGCERNQLNPTPVIRRATGSDETPGSGVAAQKRAETAEQAEKRRELAQKALAAGPLEQKMPESEGEKERDLEGELKRLVGNPSACLKTRSQSEGPKTIYISVRATVMATGSISRAEVSSSSLDEEERKCIDRRVTASRFAGPVEEAPRTVQTTIEIRQAGL